MPNYAFCSNQYCNNVFLSAIQVQGNFKDLVISKNIEFCQMCGAQASGVEGVFDIVGDVYEFKSGPLETIGKLENIARILRHAKEARLSQAEVLSQVDSVSPDVGGKFRAWINGLSVFEWMSVIDFLLMIAMSAIAVQQAYFKVETPAVSHTSIVNQTFINKTVNIGKVVQGRNEPCACESGKKYKKCCGMKR